MPLEAAQILYTVLYLFDTSESWRAFAPLNKSKTRKGYRPTHKDHPVTKWAQESLSNYVHVADYGLALCKEYTKRYHKVSHVEQHLFWLKDNPPERLLDFGITPIPLCVKKTSRREKTRLESDPIKVIREYRKFYIETKWEIAKYKYTERPLWFCRIKKTKPYVQHPSSCEVRPLAP